MGEIVGRQKMSEPIHIVITDDDIREIVVELADEEFSNEEIGRAVEEVMDRAHSGLDLADIAAHITQQTCVDVYDFHEEEDSDG